jgi:predicted AlkP superfamily phosphohydrolase/phosphomutase
MAKQVIVIGMDGADPGLALTWAQEGRLPHLQQLLARGAGGTLLSVPNAMSPSAWSSFATGLNPGRHGVFYFLDRKPGTYELMHSGSRTREGVPFWQTLSAAGKRVALLFEPITYPAEALNGVHLCGWLAPSLTSPGYGYPADLMAEVRRLFPDFILHTGMTEFIRRGRYDLALERKLASIRNRGKLARWVYQQEPWDCFTVVFDETDAISHYFWHFHDPAHPRHEPDTAHRYDDAVFDTYRAVDEQIGLLLELAPPDAQVLVMSDHGSRRNSRGALYLRGLLRELGLEVPRTRAGAGHKAAGVLHSLAETALSSSLKHKAVGLWPGLASRLIQASSAGEVDYYRSRAYTFWCNGGAEPWLNLAGRDPNGLVDPGVEVDELVGLLTEALLGATEAGTGEPLVAGVQRAAEVYHGPHVNRAPDLLVQWTDTVVQQGLRTQSEGREIVVTEPASEDLRTGNHRREGLLIAAGPQVQPGEVRAQIEDLAPTILSLLEVPLPADLDGRPLSELFTSLTPAPDHPADAAPPPPSAAAPYTAAEEAAIQERLQDLGYL